MLGLLPVLFVETDVRHAEKALKLHPYCFQVSRNPDTLSKVILRLFNVTLEEVGDGELAVAERHGFIIISWNRNIECLLEFIRRTMILSQES